MKKRVLSTVLWFFAAWYVANILAFFLGVSDSMGPIIGLAAAALIGGDPFRVIWTASSGSSPVASAATLASKSHVN